MVGRAGAAAYVNPPIHATSSNGGGRRAGTNDRRRTYVCSSILWEEREGQMFIILE